MEVDEGSGIEAIERERDFLDFRVLVVRRRDEWQWH
jgi:hypothetical protein